MALSTREKMSRSFKRLRSFKKEVTRLDEKEKMAGMVAQVYNPSGGRGRRTTSSSLAWGIWRDPDSKIQGLEM
jgi:hypothetical protein